MGSIPGGIGLVSSGLGIASSVAGMGGSPANQSYGGRAGTYIPTGQPQADQYAQGIQSTLDPYVTSLPGQVIPGYQQYASNIQNNPYAGQAQQGAGTAASAGATSAGNLGAAGQQLYGAAGQVLQTGFDPQQALYNQSINNLQQQYGASNAAQGLTGPAAAGVENQGLNNFNIAWQQQQLANQTNALGAASSADTNAGNLQNLGYSTEATSSALPFSTYLNQQNQDISALNSLTAGTSNAISPSQTLYNMLASYLNLGQSASGQAIQGQGQNFSENAQIGQQLGQSLSGLSNSSLFAPSVPTGLGGPDSGIGAYGLGGTYSSTPLPTSTEYGT